MSPDEGNDATTDRMLRAFGALLDWIFSEGHRAGVVDEAENALHDYVDAYGAPEVATTTPPQAEAKAVPSSASPPPPPEGLSDLRWEVVETPCHPCAWKLVLRGSREDNGPSNYYDTYEGAAGAARRRNAALAATPARRVAKIDGASAPSLPEGISAPAIERYELDHGSGYDPLASMEPTGSAFDGDWVRYEDHVAAIARAERAEKERDDAWQMLGEFTDIAIFAHPTWAFDGNSRTVLGWMKADYATLGLALTERDREADRSKQLADDIRAAFCWQMAGEDPHYDGRAIANALKDYDAPAPGGSSGGEAG